jgi:hypothetical protein
MIIFIDGAWKDDGSRFENYMCVIGKPSVPIFDNDVFFYFKDVKEFHEVFMYESEGFTITDWRQ